VLASIGREIGLVHRSSGEPDSDRIVIWMIKP